VINDNYEELYLPYKCELLLRGSRDGFTPKIFHELCNNKPNTVAFIKVNGAEEIIGGYNPINWNPSGWGITKDSFIFSFVNKNVKDAIISNVIAAINCGTACGPYFGNDIIICSTEDQLDYYGIRCKKNFYEKKIRDTEDCFSIEDYEARHSLTFFRESLICFCKSIFNSEGAAGAFAKFHKSAAMCFIILTYPHCETEFILTCGNISN
ncbi:hypothetical protein C1646_673997, partial [Rhizophagus diaphanus]